MKPLFLFFALLMLNTAHGWGFFAHRRINRYAVFLLPPEMLVFYKPNLAFIEEHAVDPDKRRYILSEEGPRHYIDLDRLGSLDSIPRQWDQALARYGNDSLMANGIIPWWIQTMQYRLTKAFRERNAGAILKLSAEIGHYIADAHVPLHANSNHNGQYTGQRGIHAFWESRIPELLVDSEWKLLNQRACYLPSTSSFIWARIKESGAAADTVLLRERELSILTKPDAKFSFEPRKGKTIRQYSNLYSMRYNKLLNGMIERRMRQSIEAVAAFWYTAWVDAGQPDLSGLGPVQLTNEEEAQFRQLNKAWSSDRIKGREEE